MPTPRRTRRTTRTYEPGQAIDKILKRLAPIAAKIKKVQESFLVGETKKKLLDHFNKEYDDVVFGRRRSKKKLEKQLGLQEQSVAPAKSPVKSAKSPAKSAKSPAKRKAEPGEQKTAPAKKPRRDCPTVTAAEKRKKEYEQYVRRVEEYKKTEEANAERRPKGPPTPPNFPHQRSSKKQRSAYRRSRYCTLFEQLVMEHKKRDKEWCDKLRTVYTTWIGKDKPSVIPSTEICQAKHKGANHT